MTASDQQGSLLELDHDQGNGDRVTIVNQRCRLETSDGYCVVSVGAMPIAHFALTDAAGRAHAMVSLVEMGWAQQVEVAAAFACSPRTVRRNQRRYDQGGLAALGRPRGYPKGKPRVPTSRSDLVGQWKADGLSNRQIARRLGVTEKAVRKLLRRLGWEPEATGQISMDLDLEGADPKLSALAPADHGASSSEVVEAASAAVEPEDGASEQDSEGADPKLSALDPGDDESLTISLDADPADRRFDRVLATLGLLDDAAPLFRKGAGVPGAGVLLALPALIDSGVFEITAEVYGSIGPAFYGLRTTIVTLLLMALLRIKHPEGLKERSPGELGRLIGLDRAPEVKTLRKKLARLAALGRATDFGRELAKRRVATRGRAMGFLYVDGHVRAYHGRHSLPKAHLARMRLSMPATTDYWVNDADGEPLFVVTAEANEGLVKMLPVILEEARELVGDRRLTVVFDRGGWSPKLFAALLDSGFDILTYRKGRSRPVPRRCFTPHEATIEGRLVSYQLADKGVYLGYGPAKARKRLHLRQVTRLGSDGHQTPILTSRRDLSALMVALRMFGRWRQENFFKYLRQEYALDALVDYDVEAADAARDVPNPRRRQLNAQLRKAYTELSLLAAEYGVEAFTDVESARRTLRAFKKANAPLEQQIRGVLERITALEKKRSQVPTRVPVEQVTEGEVIKLSTERKHLTDLLKMVAYQAESDLVLQVSPHYSRVEQEGRTLIQNALDGSGDLDVVDGALVVSLDPLSAPHRTEALVSLCTELNAAVARFPGTALRLRYEVKALPKSSLAFPGARSSSTANEIQPDISAGG